ncbi:uncharacterized protein LOC130622185 isoform X2 [Hydractinia symbiolongicarpus]|uniref:uncharacterized protein LOC130622185 isoform X2 n=1 Tax=Hydractinia symbiolongicarpus TaxID=13093 RepID=UPI00254D0649|nr:uncharacterized protein LOC130622185 isoform X2 [Hydractinia symbiolongicarpus]
MATYPQHEHPLHLTDSFAIYPQYQGQWNCDNCEITYDRTHTPYHCPICSYDICQNCFQQKKHPRHVHSLYLSKMTGIYPQYNGEWKCDACQRTKGPPTSPTAYHCFQDEFDLCHECFNGRNFSIHIHPLVPADAKNVYDNSPGWWICDSCKRTGIQMGTQYSWHCPECEFDCCDRCLQEVKISDHTHPLKITDSRIAYPTFNGGWKCDICGTDANPQTPGVNMDKPFHCFTCQFDACHNCVNQALVRDHQNRVHGDSESGYGYDVVGAPVSAYRHVESAHVENHVHQPPMDDGR